MDNRTRLAVDLPAELAFAHRIADLAGQVSMELLRTGGIGTETKSDGSPVTSVDVLVERELRALVERERPGDDFWGEESGRHGQGPDRWIVDPVDGTRSLLAGEPEWGTLIARARAHSVHLGLVSSPPLGRRWWAVTGAGAWTAEVSASGTETGAMAKPEPLRVTATDRLDRARVGLWPPPWRAGERAQDIAAELVLAVGNIVPALDWAEQNPEVPEPPKPSAGSGTCHGGLLVATGQLDAFLLLGGGPWDVAALVPIVREAGGAFSALQGEDRFDTGIALFSNSRIHDEVLDAVLRAIDLRRSALSRPEPGQGGVTRPLS